MRKVVGMGAALVDILVQVDDAWIEKAGSPKGGMTAVDEAMVQKLLAKAKSPIFVPGGAACNTIVGYAMLGGNAAFISKIGEDSLGDIFLDHLKNSGVESLMLRSKTGTGQVLVAVTPDAQRTMFTYLGASNLLDAEDLTISQFESADFLYLEGYRAYNEKCFRRSISFARQQKALVVIDFGAFGVVQDCRPLFDSIFQARDVDIIIANEDEAFAYTESRDEEALEKLSALASIAVVKAGSRGVWVSQGGHSVFVPAYCVKALDTTGAGDLWASGFLYGIAWGWDLEKAARLGNYVASEVIQVMGPRIPVEGYERIGRLIDNDFNRN